MMTKKKHQNHARSLVVKKLERVSKELFSKYHNAIIQLVGSSPGIYALYDDDDLYYVGKSINLRQRVRAHLSDRHEASWTHFSLYLLRRTDHISEIESLLVSISNPKGNKVTPRGRATGALLNELRKSVKSSQREEFARMFGGKTTLSKKGSGGSKQRSLTGYVSKPTVLYRTYKGKEYKATLYPRGIIIFKGKQYKTPSAASNAIVDHPTSNGWHFWWARNRQNEWVRLSDYAG